MCDPFVIDGKKHVNHKLLLKKPDPATSTFLLNVCNRAFCKGCVYYEIQHHADISCVYAPEAYDKYMYIYTERDKMFVSHSAKHITE